MLQGLCSNFIKRLAPGTDNVRAFVRQSLFRMPPDPSNQPMIMVAAGAGLAPLRAFLQERQFLKDKGVALAPAHLYFGVTHPDQVLRCGLNCLNTLHRLCYSYCANYLVRTRRPFKTFA
jgi:sulfite reductase alpha subunit-like flavoprotein